MNISSAPSICMLTVGEERYSRMHGRTQNMGKGHIMCSSECRARTVTTRGKEEKREFIPRLYTLRRIEPRYRHLLPLHIMKRYRCIVVGGKRGMLTVALTGGVYNEHIIAHLRQQTGCAIFPVLIEPERMRLLLQRAEWSECHKESVKRNKPLLHPLFLHSLLPLLSYNAK